MYSIIASNRSSSQDQQPHERERERERESRVNKRNDDTKVRWNDVYARQGQFDMPAVSSAYLEHDHQICRWEYCHSNLLLWLMLLLREEV